MSLRARCTDIQLKDIREVRGSTVVVYDDYGNPIVVVVEHQIGLEMVYLRTDPDFPAQLKLLGLAPVSPARRIARS